MTKPLKLKIVTGFTEDQKYTIDADEAHKAYFLFLNPDARGIFANGLAIIGRHIQAIQPDYHATLGYNKTHKLDSDDWNEINGSGVEKRMQETIERAKSIAGAISGNPGLLSLKMSEIELFGKPEQLPGQIKAMTEGIAKRI